MSNKILLSILLLCCSVVCSAVARDNETSDSTVLFKDRIAVRSNAVNWFLMTPNVGVEYDIVSNKYKKVSLNLSGRYNWNSNFKSPQRYVYNIAGAKAEARWYFRTYKRNDWETEWINSAEGFYEKLQARKHTIKSRNNPRSYRAYYVGPYLSYDKYTLKLSETGYQGSTIGLGLSFGYDVPLYKYNDGSAIDFEFGASAGFMYTGYDKFEYEPDSRCYRQTGTKDAHLVPYPIITDINVAMVYRLKSIREQIVEVDSAKLQMMKNAYELRKAYNEAMTVPTSKVKSTKVRINAKGDTVRDKNTSQVLYDTIYHRTDKYVNSDSMSIFNADVTRKNNAVKEYNARLAKISDADSTLYLQKLKPMYRYLKLSDKMLSYGYKKTIPNMKIDSISELKNAQLNEIIRSYSEIGNGDGVESVEQRMLTEYNLIRDLYIGNGDSLKDISLMEYLVKVVPALNEYNITDHNNKYFGTSAADSSNVLLGYYELYDLRVRRYVMESNVLDTIYLVEPQSFAFSGENQEIEANNDALRLQALHYFPQKAPNAAASSDKKQKKAKVKVKKTKKSKKKEDKAKSDSISQSLPDTLQNNVEQQLPDTLQNNVEQQLPDTLQNNGEETAYLFRGKLPRNFAAIEQKVVNITSARN